MPSHIPVDFHYEKFGSPPREIFRLLVVDHDASVRRVCCEVGEKLGFQICDAATVGEAEAMLATGVDVMLLSLRVAGESSQPLLQRSRLTYPKTIVIATASYATVETVVETMRNGATDYLSKPFALEDLVKALERAQHKRTLDLEKRRLREEKKPPVISSLIGTSPAMQQLRRMIGKVSQSNHPVLILGESGTGKELVAKAVHSSGSNQGRPFLAIDCGALTPTLIESELFGHVRGAFTGAHQAKEGLLVAADQGTVFLDEIGELPLDLQAKLLRALQEKEVRPVGATQTRPIKARVVAATNRDLPAMVEQGCFRKDLYFRLNVVNVRVPPLRSRIEDVPLLAAHFLDNCNRNSGTNHSLSDDALKFLCEYNWPGNVRELEHAIERACMITTSPVLPLSSMTTSMLEHQQHHEMDSQIVSVAPSPGSYLSISTLSPRIEDLEKQAILSTIQQLNGDKLMAAKVLGIGKTTLYRKLKEYGIELK